MATSRLGLPQPAPARQWIAAAVDTVLELSVVGSFSRVGPAVRGRLERWSEPSPGALTGRTALVTGPTSGLGRGTARALARLGARVVLVGRDAGRLETLRAELIAEQGTDEFPTIAADLATLAGVRTVVDRVLATERRLDVLVDNAGAIHPQRTMTVDGMESTFALMVVAPFALEAGLLPLLQESRGRVIAVTSGGMYTQPLDLDDLQGAAEPWSGPRAYARAKRAQTALIREWARRTADPHVTFSAMHPGWADTPGLAESLPTFRRRMRPLLRSVDEGIDTILWLATQPDGARRSGRLFLDRRPRPFDRLPTTRLSPVDRRRLWDTVVQLAGIDDPAPGIGWRPAVARRSAVRGTDPDGESWLRR